MQLLGTSLGNIMDTKAGHLKGDIGLQSMIVDVLVHPLMVPAQPIADPQNTVRTTPAPTVTVATPASDGPGYAVSSI